MISDLSLRTAFLPLIGASVLSAALLACMRSAESKRNEAPAAPRAPGADALESPPIEDHRNNPQAAPTPEGSNERNPETDRSQRSPAEPGGAQILDMEVPGFEPALVALPEGAGPFAVLFATHGAGGEAEHLCAYWLSFLDEPTVIVCPRGTRMAKNNPSGGYFYRTHLSLEKEVLAITRELEKRPSVGPKPWVYSGYSQGATMGALMIVNHGDLFDRLILLEGGTEGWTKARAQKYVSGGGKRVIFGCGTDSCAAGADKAAKAMAEGGLDVRTHMADGAGHTYASGVRRVIAPELDWLFGATSN